MLRSVNCKSFGIVTNKTWLRLWVLSLIHISETQEPDIAISTTSWRALSIQLDELLTPGAKVFSQLHTHDEEMAELARKPNVAPEIAAKALDLSKAAASKAEKLAAIYDFVSQKIATVDLPLGATGFTPRPPAEILSAGYATPEDKFVIFAALASAIDLGAKAALTGYCDAKGSPGLSAFNHLLILANDGQTNYWLDPSLEAVSYTHLGFAGLAPHSGRSSVPFLSTLFRDGRFFPSN